MKKVFGFIVLSYILFFCVTLPSQTPDEQGHYEMVYWMSRFTYPFVTNDKNSYPYGADEGALFNFGNENPNLMVNFTRVRDSVLQKQTAYPKEQEEKFIPESGQAYNPPLYYLISAGFLKIAQFFHTSIITQFYAARLASTFFYFATVIVFSWILKMFYDNTKTQKGVLLFFSLNPLFLQSGIGISPDIAVTFFGTLFLFLVLKKIKNGTVLRPMDLIVMGVIAGLAALSKISGVFLLPAFIIFLYPVAKKTFRWLRACCIFLFTFLITQLPYLSLNWVRYHKFVVEDVALGVVESKTYSISVTKALILTFTDFRHTFMHFAGFLGQNDVFPFPPVFFLYTLILLSCTTLGVVIIWKGKSLSGKFLLLSGASVLLFFFVLSFERKIYFHPGWGIGGRNILLIYPQLVLFFVTGLISFKKSASEFWGMLLTCFSVFYYFFIIIFVLLPRYYV